VPAALAALATVLGLLVGSFLNVVVARVPDGRSVVRPPSACPRCDTVLLARDNVPVLSWLALRGRCRTCRAPISWRYPAVEVLTAGLFALVARRFGWSPSLPAELLLVTGLVPLAVIDAERLILPRRIVWPTGAAVLAALVAAATTTGQWHRLGVAAICAAAAFAAFLALHLVSPSGLGFGDVRLAPVIALATGWLGWEAAVVAFFVANLVGAVVGVALIATGRRSRRSPVPLGVFLAVGAVVALVVGGPLRLR
jgi:leader peptidase (prepilin peptidase)/N-methyltransferase